MREHGIRAQVALAALASLLLAAAPARAITDEEVFRTFRFNFINPGGRAGAMGGSFIGIADDSTAAAANPAGLTNLISPEFFSELRLTSADPVHLVANVGDRDGYTKLVTESNGNPEDIFNPSFLSYVKPFKSWVIGVSRQEVLNQRVDTTSLLSTGQTTPPTDLLQADGRIEIELVNWNVSAGFKAGEHFAAGVTGTVSRLDVKSRTDNYVVSPVDGPLPDYSTVVDDADEALTWSVGLLFKPKDIIHIGVVYRQGASFDLSEAIVDRRTSTRYPSAGELADYLGNRNLAYDPAAPFGFAASTFDDPMTFRNHFKVPDQYGIGIGIRPVQELTIAVDAVRVEYSQLTDGLVGNVNALTFPGDAPDCDLAHPNPDGTFPCTYVTPLATYQIDDETLWHLGIEYVWTIKDKIPFALRGGAYRDSGSRLAADFPAGGVFGAANDSFPKAGDFVHYTVGVGLVLQEKFQADFVGDFSSSVNSYVASIIYHF